MAEGLTKGLFITFEGPEGSGKSTQSRMMMEELTSKGYDCLHTREPGGTSVGKRIREVLLDKDDIKLSSSAELFLFEADRAQHVRNIIRPAMDEKKVVICDRFNTATFAYQGYGLGVDMELIKKIDDSATGGLKPDLTVLFDIDVEVGISRATAGREADKMEKRSLEFHRRVREGYLKIAEEDPETIKVIKVDGKIDETFGKVKKEVYAVVERYKGAG